MCGSSIGNVARMAVQPVAQITGADLLARKTLGTSVTDTLTPKDEGFKTESPTVAKSQVARKRLAIGTQIGGTPRSPLGSSSGINTGV